jgi:hypothetical protein
MLPDFRGAIRRLEDKESDLAKEYVKAIELLTVSDEKVLREQVEKLKANTADMELMKKMHLSMKLDLEAERERSALMIKYMMSKDPVEKAQIARELIARGYVPKTPLK